VQQGIQQSDMDRDYFPAAFQEKFDSGTYVAGPRSEVWKAYALRDVQRGREIARLVRQKIPLAGRRVLDAGCSYGGTLIAFAEQAANVVGLEIDAERARTAHDRLAALNIEAEIHKGDVCDLDTSARLGTFDVITLQDVIEHVLRPEEMIRGLAALLRPGGIIYVKVGNKYSLDQLRGDHHFNLPGLTIIARAQAMEYFRLATGNPESSYDVGFWKTDAWYRKVFARNGIALEHVESYPSPQFVAYYSPWIQSLCERARQEVYPGLRPELQERIRRRMMVVARYYARVGQSIIDAQSNAELTAKLCDRAVKRVCAPVWQFIGTKCAEMPAKPMWPACTGVAEAGDRAPRVA
jgi:SAM-dependent methyltransferase